MNVANLQLEGLLIAIASLNNLLVRKGILSVDEIDTAMAKAEANIIGDERVYEDMPPAQRDATCFPIRLLKLANLGQSENSVQSFAELARLVGQTKEPYNDQR